MTDQPSMWQRSTTRRFLKWLFTWRTMRRLLLAASILVTVYALVCTEETLRGKRAWQNYRRELEAQGEQLDFKAFIPTPVPDDQNFAATPFIKSWFVRSNFTYVNAKYWDNDIYGKVGPRVTEGKKGGKLARGRHTAPQAGNGNRHFTDLVGWRMAFGAARSDKLEPNQEFGSDKLDLESRAEAASSILEGLKTNEAVFAELRAAIRRPYSRYPVDWNREDPSEILLPHLQHIRSICRRLQLKACAELASGQSERALEDVELIFDVADSIKNEPFFIPYLVRAACLQHAIQPIWEGLAEHTWSDEQMRELQARLRQYDFIADMKQPLLSERAAALATIDYVRRRGPVVLIAFNSRPLPWERMLSRLAGVLIPSGWYDQEKLSYCQIFRLQMEGSFDPSKRRIFPQQIRANAKLADKAFSGREPFDTIVIHHRLMAGILLPSVSGFQRRAAEAQTLANEAVIGCSLERYRLARGQVPEELQILVPQFIPALPNDTITGEPYKYRRTDDGQFILYSVGRNEKDDGGIPGKVLFDEKEGDWVWQYPKL